MPNSMKAIEPKSFIYLFILFHFICHTIITKNIGKVEKKKWCGDLTETIGAYEGLGLLKLWAIELFNIN